MFDVFKRKDIDSISSVVAVVPDGGSDVLRIHSTVDAKQLIYCYFVVLKPACSSLIKIHFQRL